MKTFARILPVLALCAPLAAAPVTTVPWNGHRGAVSFTFDDALESQIRYVLPALKERGIHATFFMVGSSGSWTGDRAQWIQAARDGNELANHTLTHASLGGLDSAGVEEEIAGMADSLRAADSSIQAVTLAYPYCATTDLIDRIAERENIIARICGWDPRWNARSTWGEPPVKWMEANSIGITDTATVRAALTEIDRADSARSWLVTLNHGIMDNSYGPISDTAVESMFDRALSRDLWIGTYMEVAAYWRASMVMDTARATSSGEAWTLSWKSPHPRMPRSVRLRVRLDSATFGTGFSVSQGGTRILPESDGSYVVEFMKLSLQVSRTVSISGASTRHSIHTRMRGANLEISGLEAGSWNWEQRTLGGRLLRSGRDRAEVGGTLAVPASHSGIAILRLRHETGSVIELRTAPRLGG